MPSRLLSDEIHAVHVSEAGILRVLGRRSAVVSDSACLPNRRRSQLETIQDAFICIPAPASSLIEPVFKTSISRHQDKLPLLSLSILRRVQRIVNMMTTAEDWCCRLPFSTIRVNVANAFVVAFQRDAGVYVFVRFRHVPHAQVLTLSFVWAIF
jgi:hypothetical protein